MGAFAEPVQADPMRLRLLLRNLLENALRHGAGGDTPVTVFVRRESDGRLALGVRDFGPGVPADQLPLLAQAFYRPDSARTRRSGGVGLGLYLCRLVAQAHGGELRIQNALPGLEVAMVWGA
jgi:signal transduction histidine kinase